MMREDGERGPGKDPNPAQLENVAMCVSNPELHKYIADYLDAVWRENLFIDIDTLLKDNVE